MKKVPCSNPTCNQRRRHHETPDEDREIVMCSVPDTYTGKAFCSITCACYAGYYDVKKGWIKNPNDSSEAEQAETTTTTLTDENARRFIEIIEQEETNEKLRELLKRGLEESAAGQTTVLNLDDLADEED